jgi:peptide subunit release factor RF-3
MLVGFVFSLNNSMHTNHRQNFAFFDIQKTGRSLLESKMKAKYDIKKSILYFPRAEMGFCVPKKSKIYYLRV